MAEQTLITDPDDMRHASKAVSELTEEFNAIREELKESIGVTLNEECEGDIAQTFTQYYNDNIDPKLALEKDQLDGATNEIKNSAEDFEDTGNRVKSSFK